MSDLELLRIEMELLWGDSEGPELVIACARDGTFVRANSSVPAGFAKLTGLSVEDLRVRLENALGAAITVAAASGPSYLIESDVEFLTTARLIRSDSADLSALRDANPGNWGVEEWHDLLDGLLGPWVMAVVDDQVVSICHTPVSNARAAEAGTWTHARFRGQGYAAACTAQWAEIMRPTQKLLFYSTSRTNYSSQRVAVRLGLRHLGDLWQLQRVR